MKKTINIEYEPKDSLINVIFVYKNTIIQGAFIDDFLRDNDIDIMNHYMKKMFVKLRQQLRANTD